MIEYVRGAELPNWTPTLWNDAGAVVDLTGAAFTVTIDFGGATPFEKTTGITGTDTAPNASIAWSAGDLDREPGLYEMTLQARVASKDYKITTLLRILRSA